MQMAIKRSWERTSNRFAVEEFGVFGYCLARRSWCGFDKPINKDDNSYFKRNLKRC